MTAPDAIEGLDAAVRAIAGLRSVDEVLQVIVDRVRPLVGAQYAALGIFDAGGRIERFVTSGIDDETRRRIGPLPRGRGLLGLIVRENRTIRIDDIAADPNSSGFPPNHPPMRTFLGVPVTVQGVSVGNLYLTNKAGNASFSTADQRLVETFALHAGIAIDNARLHERLQGLALTDERDRISQDLHDGIIQTLYAAGLMLEDVPELMTGSPAEAEARIDRAVDQIHVAIRDIRNFIFGLNPELFDADSLVGGLASLVERFRHSTSIEASLQVGNGTNAADLEPPSAVTAELLAIALEALSNVARHARAARVEVSVGRSGGDIVVAIVDDGVGLDPSRSTPGHHGLDNMRARAGRIGGELSVHASRSTGTRVEVSVPVG
jgi:signal transduction histidine kinase